jgi:hypothetical protein
VILWLLATPNKGGLHNLAAGLCSQGCAVVHNATAQPPLSLGGLRLCMGRLGTEAGLCKRGVFPTKAVHRVER